MERLSPSLYFAEKYAGKFAVGDPVDSAVLEKATLRYRAQMERDRVARRSSVARVTTIKLRG